MARSIRSSPYFVRHVRARVNSDARIQVKQDHEVSGDESVRFKAVVSIVACIVVVTIVYAIAGL